MNELTEITTSSVAQLVKRLGPLTQALRVRIPPRELYPFFSFTFFNIFQKNVSLPTNLHFFQKSFICFLVLMTPSFTYPKERTTFLKVMTLTYRHRYLPFIHHKGRGSEGVIPPRNLKNRENHPTENSSGGAQTTLPKKIPGGCSLPQKFCAR